jgi:putative salt-induced outer membrane protein YdiY
MSRRIAARTKGASRVALLALVAVSCAIVASLAGAEEVKTAWQPKAPDGLPTDFDWIRLPSDEWLKGEILSMYDDKLEFDSDELGTLTFDFTDLREVRSSRVVQIGFEGREPVIGRLLLDGATARVVGDGGEVSFPRAEILTIIVGTPKEINYWSGYASLSGNVRSGNTDQIDYTARLGTTRRSVRDRVGFAYIGNITRINSEDTSNNHRANLGWDHFTSQRLFINVAGLEWYRDPFQNVGDRWTVTAGVCYQLYDTSRTAWSVTAGPAWQSTRWESVPPDEDETADSVALRIGTRFSHEVTDDIDIYAIYDGFFADQASGSYSHHLDTGITMELIGDLDLTVAWVWDHIQEPSPLADGTFPKNDDTRLTFGLGWSF